MAAMGIHERKSETIVSPNTPTNRRRFRRTRSEGCADDIKRQQQLQAGSNSKWLVDYSSKQADLSPNSLLRLQALVEGGSTQSTAATQKETPKIKLNQLQLQLDADDFPSTFEDNSVSSDAAQDTTTSGLPQHKLLSPRSPDQRQKQEQEKQGGVSSSSSVCSNSLAGDSEHSINLDKVFESQHTAASKAASKAQEALYCISVTISDQNEKIKFSLRNPEVLRALRKALAENGAQPEQENDLDDDDDSSSEEKQQSAPTNSTQPQPQQQQQRSSIKRREIKCVIPHDRFQLPQMQVFRQPEQRSSNASSSTATGAAATSTTHLNNLKLHCIDEANESEMMAPSEESQISMAASSLQSSCCESFAGDSLKDDNESTTSGQGGNANVIKVFQESTTDSSLKIEKASEQAEEEEEEESASEEEQHSLMQHRYLQQLREQPQQAKPTALPQGEKEVEEEEEEGKSKSNALHEKPPEEEEEESDSEEEHCPMQLRYLQQLQDQPKQAKPYAHQKPQVEEEEAEEEEEEESYDETVRNNIIGLYVTDESLRHSIAESTLAPSVVEELEADDLLLETADEAGDEFETDAGDDDDDTETESGYGVGLAYGVLNHPNHHNNEVAAFVGGASASAIAAYGASLSEVGYEDDSQTECNYGDSISQIGNSGTTIGDDSQTEAGYYGDSQSMVVYESEIDRAYDGDDTEVAMEEDDGDRTDLTATNLGVRTDQGEEEESADEYEEDMEEEETYLPRIVVSAAEEEEEAGEGEIRDEADEMESKAACPVQESDAEESERDAAETDGEESQVTNGTDESSQNNNAMTRGLSVYLSAHSRKGNSYGGGGGSRSRKKSSSSSSVMKNCNDSQTVTSVTASMTTGMDTSNMTNNTGSTGLTLKSHTTNRTSRSDPLDLLRHENSLRSLRTSKSTELDDCNRSMRLEDLSKNSRGSSAPSDDSYSRASSAPSEDSFSRRRRGGRRPLSRMLAGDSQVSYDASKSSFFQNAPSESDADDNSTVNSSVDHRRRRPRGQRRGSLLIPGPNASGIIPRSNTPQGALLRTRSGDSISSSSRSRASSIKGDARPLLPPRQISRDRSDNVNEDSRRRAPRRSKSMIDSSSGTNGMAGRSRGLNRTKSRESFLGGSRIKKWDGSAANRSGHGLSLLERHLDSGGKSSTKNKRHSRRRASISISKANSSIASGLSVPSLIQSLPKEV